jgi:hypothetical protein
LRPSYEQVLNRKIKFVMKGAEKLGITWDKK